MPLQFENKFKPEIDPGENDDEEAQTADTMSENITMQVLSTEDGEEDDRPADFEVAIRVARIGRIGRIGEEAKLEEYRQLIVKEAHREQRRVFRKSALRGSALGYTVIGGLTTAGAGFVAGLLTGAAAGTAIATTSGKKFDA